MKKLISLFVILSFIPAIAYSGQSDFLFSTPPTHIEKEEKQVPASIGPYFKYRNEPKDKKDLGLKLELIEPSKELLDEMDHFDKKKKQNKVVKKRIKETAPKKKKIMCRLSVPNLIVNDSTDDPEKLASLREVFLLLKKEIEKNPKKRKDLISLSRIFKKIEENKYLTPYILSDFVNKLDFIAESNDAKNIMCYVVLPTAKLMNFTKGSAAAFYYYLAKFYEQRHNYELAESAYSAALAQKEDSEFYKGYINCLLKMNKDKKASEVAIMYVSYMKEIRPADAIKLAKSYYERFRDYPKARKYFKNLLID